MAKTIDEIAAQYFGGNLTRMAQANSMTPQLLSRYKAKGCVVIDGVLMKPWRSLVDANGQEITDHSSDKES
jgi:hypothetical protein